MNMVASVIILFIWMFLIPTAIGGFAAMCVKSQKRNVPFLWVTGQLFLWAIFQMVCVPMILKQHAILIALGTEAFPVLVVLMQILGLGLAILGTGLLVKKKCPCKNSEDALHVVSDEIKSMGHLYKILWVVFAVLLILQLVMAVTMTYRDEDDAYYVATATIAAESNTMFRKQAYTGGTTGLDARHGLAPFSIWMAFLARVSGVPAVTVAHIFVPILSILMAYAIYYLIGCKLLRKGNRERLPLYLVFTELLILFGNYSRYTSENFLIARSRQGKAALGSLMVPLVFYLMLEILGRMQENIKIEKLWWILLACTVMTGCLCSTMGAVLMCVLIGLIGICSAVCYKRLRLLILSGTCCVPAVVYALLYLVLK